MEKKTEEKKMNWSRVATVIGIAIVLVVAFIALWKLSGEDKKPSNQLVFTVGTEEVYLDEVNFCILQNVMNLGITAQSMEGVKADNGIDAADYYKDEIKQLIMDYKVAYQIAKKQGLSVTEEEKALIQKDVTTYLGKVDARLLNYYGVDKDIIEEIYTQRYLGHKVEKEAVSDLKIEDDKYCAVYMLLFPKIEMEADGSYVTLEDGETPIMLSDDEINKRKKDADEALVKLKDGAEIEAIAKEYGVEAFSSEERNLAKSFGEPFSKYTTTLKTGEYSPVLETESCYAILKMVEENNQELADQIISHYRADKEKELLQEKRAEWRRELGVSDEPVFSGKVWEQISLYDYVSGMEE
ncbi:MAG: hypothetical protein E7264_04360 [Lachnospiraceae bacterium]|nr:hypothetical protein [Lachnospiraceae bacterium]